MGDHYCCNRCHQRYDECMCIKAEPAKPMGFPRQTKAEVLTVKIELSDELKDELAKLNNRLDHIEKEVSRMYFDVLKFRPIGG